MLFSQRIGKTQVKVELEKNGLSQELRNSLWNILLEVVINSKDTRGYKEYSPKSIFFRNVWKNFFKLPIDDLRLNYSISSSMNQVDYEDVIKIIKKWFFGEDWFRVLDFIEFCVNYDNNKFAIIFNATLKKEMSAFRFVEGKLVAINSDEEIIEIENTIKKSDKFEPVKIHLKQALSLYSDRKNPDYRNSIKESISSVEALGRLITKKDSISLGEALNEIERDYKIPKEFKKAFGILYGYTSNEGGIRHSLKEKNLEIKMEEARFMLVTCSAFSNYLINKIS